MIDYFERVLRFKNLEVWDIRLENDAYRMIIFDENRQAADRPCCISALSCNCYFLFWCNRGCIRTFINGKVQNGI